MTVNCKKIFDNYLKTSKKETHRVSTSELSVLHNIVRRSQRDPEYANELKKFDTGMGDDIVSLIEKYFAAYNTRYGLDIRDSLLEYDDPEFTEGAYFKLITYKIESDGKMREHIPTEFEAGDRVHAKATLYSHATDQPMIAKRLYGSFRTEDGESGDLYAYDTDTIEFDFTLSREGSVMFTVDAQDADGKLMVGAESACGGAVFSKDKIKPTHTPPADIDDFWRGELKRMMSVDPRGESADGYDGRVLSTFDMPKKNHFGMRKFDESYIDMFAENGYTPPSKETLNTHDSYEVYLKAPGPCHSSGFLSIPKNCPEGGMPLTISFDGYSAYAPMPVYAESEIRVHSTHHGYEMGMPSVGYYKVLSGKGGILECYGRSNGAPNSDYEDIHDCYMTYLHLRNMQMIRFFTDPTLSGDIPLLHKYWNGKVKLTGGSMGGYQTVFASALCALLKELGLKFEIIYSGANVPAFCNLAGRIDGRFGKLISGYAENSDYFDAALVAHLVDSPLEVQRVGLGDPSCPTTSILSMFNSLPSHIMKKVKLLQNSSHGYKPDPDLQEWFCYKYNMGDIDYDEMVF